MYTSTLKCKQNFSKSAIKRKKTNPAENRGVKKYYDSLNVANALL